MKANEILLLGREIEDLMLESDGELTDDIMAKIQILDAELPQTLDRYAFVIDYLKSQESWLKDQANHFASKAKTVGRSVANLRERIAYLMESIGESKVKSMAHNYSLRETTSIDLRMEDLDGETMQNLMTLGLVVYESVVKTDKTKLKEWAKAQEHLPEYVVLNHKKSVNIR